MGFFGAGIGAGVGGYLGGSDGGGWGGLLGGAAGGAAVGGVGAGLVKFAMPNTKGVAGLAGKGYSGATNLLGKGEAMIGSNKGWIGKNYNNIMTPHRRNKLGFGLATGEEWIGNNAAQINTWGGRALMGLGMASGASIGSSIIQSNRGYR